MPPQYRGHLAVANLEARLQDHRRLPERHRSAFRAVFRQFTSLCRELNLFGRELLAVDGTRIKAVNNKGSTRAMPRKPRPTARAPKTSRRRSRRCARSAGDTG